MRSRRFHRSWLLTPCTGEAAMAAARDSGADALILDLGAGGARPAARAAAAAFIASRGAGDPALFVMVAPVGNSDCDEDVKAVIAAGPSGIVLPQAAGGADVTRLAALIGAAEAEAGLDEGATAILPLATQTPAAVIGLGTYAGASPRLAALAWDTALSRSLGALTTEDENGALTTPYSLIRNLCLIGAAAAGIAALDRPEATENGSLLAACDAARRDGFAGKIALSASQVPVINAVFGG